MAKVILAGIPPLPALHLAGEATLGYFGELHDCFFRDARAAARAHLARAKSAEARRAAAWARRAAWVQTPLAQMMARRRAAGPGEAAAEAAEAAAINAGLRSAR